MRVRSTLVFSSIAFSFALAAACSGSDNGAGGDDAGADAIAPIGSDAGGSGIDATTPDTGTSSPDTGASSPDTGTSSPDTGTDAGEHPDTGSTADAAITDASDAQAHDAAGEEDADAGLLDAGVDAAPTQQLVTTLGAGAGPVAVTINQGTAIGKGAGGAPSTLTDLKADPKNTETIGSSTNPFASTGNVPDTAAGFCDYPDSGPPVRISHVSGASFETDAGSDPMVPMAPFYFPLVYNTPLTGLDAGTGNAFGGDVPIIGLFDYRPKDIDEALVAAESDDNGATWYFMQTVLELNPNTATSTGCPAAVTDTNASTTAPNGSQADDGWGHATIIQLPGAGNGETGGQFLYMLDRNTNALPDGGGSIVDDAPLHAISLTHASSKFPIWNTNKTNDDIRAITTALANTPDSGAPVVVEDTVGLANPDGIMAVFPTAPNAAAGTPVKVLYVQKILNGASAFPGAQQCGKAPVSKKTNLDISNVRLAETTDGIHFDEIGGGIVEGLNDPTTVDYNKTRWISPRGTLIDINGDGSRWGLYFSGGNCLDGDSDAFHYIGYAESSDMLHWTVYNDINNPIASINTITVANTNDSGTVTIPAHAPVFPTEPWFAQRLYAPSAVQIDSTHLSMTFAGYGVQTPATDLLNYRQIGNVVLTVSKPLPAGTPNNINAHN
jgi:hypothetical protein